MKILSIGKNITHPDLDIISLPHSELSTHLDSITQSYDYILISGGDGTIRRVLKTLQSLSSIPPFILNPTGSFNVVAKLHRTPKIEKILANLAQKKSLKTQKQSYFALNEEIFLFSAGNMGDLQHIFLSETLRFGFLKHGIPKYLLAFFILFPLHLFITPFMLLSSRRFFVFTPFPLIHKIGSFYAKIKQEIVIDLENDYNMIELDGDIVLINTPLLYIKPLGEIEVVTSQ